MTVYRSGAGLMNTDILAASQPEAEELDCLTAVSGGPTSFIAPLTRLREPSYMQPGALDDYIEQVRSQVRSERRATTDPRGQLGR